MGAMLVLKQCVYLCFIDDTVVLLSLVMLASLEKTANPQTLVLTVVYVAAHWSYLW